MKKDPEITTSSLSKACHPILNRADQHCFIFNLFCERRYTML